MVVNIDELVTILLVTVAVSLTDSTDDFVVTCGVVVLCKERGNDVLLSLAVDNIKLLVKESFKIDDVVGDSLATFVIVDMVVFIIVVVFIVVVTI